MSLINHNIISFIEKSNRISLSCTGFRCKLSVNIEERKLNLVFEPVFVFEIIDENVFAKLV